MTAVAETFVAHGSSNVSQFTYDPDTNTLTVEFRDGSEYDYFNVPATTYKNWCAAGGSGTYFHRNIKGRYGYEKR